MGFNKKICFTGKVLIIHAGGFSQRFPSQSVLGKVFLTLPCSKYIRFVNVFVHSQVVGTYCVLINRTLYLKCRVLQAP